MLALETIPFRRERGNAVLHLGGVNVANYSSRMVASNKSPVKWQHRRQLAQAGQEDKIKWGIKRETAEPAERRRSALVE